MQSQLDQQPVDSGACSNATPESANAGAKIADIKDSSNRLWTSQCVTQKGLVVLHDQLKELFETSEIYPGLYPGIERVVNTFQELFGSHFDCSGLSNVLHNDGDHLRAPEPVPNPKLLEEVRKSFLQMAERVPDYFKPYQQNYYYEVRYGPVPDVEPWNLPPEADSDPLGFWTKIWDTFDFAAPQYLDTKRDFEEQPSDAHGYFKMFFELSYSHNENPYLKPDMRVVRQYDRGGYFDGRGDLEWKLNNGFGLYIRPRKQEHTVPFPWLDQELSRFRGLDWQLSADWNYAKDDTKWVMSYPYEMRSWEYFDLYKASATLVTNIRVPLPRAVLADPEALRSALEAIYRDDGHPLQMIAEARQLAWDLGGGYDDAALRAGMLYQLISTLAKYNPSLFGLLLEEERQCCQTQGVV